MALVCANRCLCNWVLSCITATSWFAQHRNRSVDLNYATVTSYRICKVTTRLEAQRPRANMVVLPSSVLKFVEFCFLVKTFYPQALKKMPLRIKMP
jgi:hypothetical protein